MRYVLMTRKKRVRSSVRFCFDALLIRLPDHSYSAFFCEYENALTIEEKALLLTEKKRKWRPIVNQKDNGVVSKVQFWNKNYFWCIFALALLWDDQLQNYNETFYLDALLLKSHFLFRILVHNNELVILDLLGGWERTRILHSPKGGYKKFFPKGVAQGKEFFYLPEGEEYDFLCHILIIKFWLYMAVFRLV